MSVPTRGESFAKLTEYLRKAQEQAAMLAHLERDHNPGVAKQWLLVAENFKMTIHVVTMLATRGLQ
jgi:hypothetical protein